MESRRRSLTETAAVALLRFKDSLTDALTPQQVERLIGPTAEAAKRTFSEAINTLSAAVSATPPGAGSMRRALVVEGTVLHLLLDIVKGVDAAAKGGVGPVNEGHISPLCDAFDEAARLVKSLPGIGRKAAACRDVQGRARRLIAQATAGETTDSVGAVHAWRLIDQAAVDIVWVAAYVVYIETGEMGEFDPRTGA